MIDETIFHIVERTEFAKLVNFNKYPVITIDVTKREREDRCAKYAVPVRVEMEYSDGRKYLSDCEFCVFDSEYVGDGKCHCTVMSYGTCISASFGYSDAMKCAKYANAPILKANGWAVVIVHNPEKKTLKCFKVKMARTIKNCQTAIMFSDEYDSWILAKAILNMAD